MTLIDEKVEELREHIVDDLDAETKAMLAEIDLRVLTGYTLSDAIREGSTVTEQAIGDWGTGETACALTAAAVAARARGYI